MDSSPCSIVRPRPDDIAGPGISSKDARRRESSVLYLYPLSRPWHARSANGSPRPLDHTLLKGSER